MCLKSGNQVGVGVGVGMGVGVMLELNTAPQLDFSFYHFQSGTTSCGNTMLTFRVGLWVVCPFWRHTHRHPQVCLSGDP